MFTMGMFAGFGFMSQLRLMMLDAGYDRPFCLRDTYVWLNRIGNVLMVPLLFCNRLGVAMKNLGLNDPNAPQKKKESTAPIDLATTHGRKAAWQMFKVLMLNPATSRIVLLFFNVCIFIMATVGMMFAARVLGSDYIGVFVSKDIVIATMVACGLLLFTSFVGCRAGSSNTFKFLIPYSAVLAVTLVIQATGAIYIYENYHTTSPEAAEAFVHDKMVTTWKEGNCTLAQTVPPFNATCTDPGLRWYQEFMNTGCEYQGPGDLTGIKTKLVEAMNTENENLVKYWSIRYQLVAGTKKRIYTCFKEKDIQHTDTTVFDTTGNAAFCVCRSVLMGNVDAMQNVAIAALTIIGIQVLLLLMSCKLMGIDLTEVSPGAIVPGQGSKVCV
jgi:hypothetical protein